MIRLVTPIALVVALLPLAALAQAGSAANLSGKTLNSEPIPAELQDILSPVAPKFGGTAADKKQLAALVADPKEVALAEIMPEVQQAMKPGQALQWYVQAAEAGNVDAMTLLSRQSANRLLLDCSANSMVRHPLFGTAESGSAPDTSSLPLPIAETIHRDYDRAELYRPILCGASFGLARSTMDGSAEALQPSRNSLPAVLLTYQRYLQLCGSTRAADVNPGRLHSVALWGWHLRLGRGEALTQRITCVGDCKVENINFRSGKDRQFDGEAIFG